MALIYCLGKLRFGMQGEDLLGITRLKSLRKAKGSRFVGSPVCYPFHGAPRAIGAQDKSKAQFRFPAEDVST